MIMRASLKSFAFRGHDAATVLLAPVPFSLPLHVAAAAVPGPPSPAVRMRFRSLEPVSARAAPAAPAASPGALPKPVNVVVLRNPSDSAEGRGPASGADMSYIQPPFSARSVQSLQEEGFWGPRCRFLNSVFFVCHECFGGEADLALLPNPHCGAPRAELSSPKRKGPSQWSQRGDARCRRLGDGC